jgi:hypothetical protein
MPKRAASGRPRTFTYSPGKSVKIRVTKTLDTPVANARTYKKQSGRAFTGEQTIELLRKELQKQSPDSVVIVRGQGGTRAYSKGWWSSAPLLVGEFEDLDDEELETLLYDLEDEDGPTALDIYIREE